MPQFVDLHTAPHCTSEYAALKKVLVCSPQYMEIKEVINETQKHYIKENIDISRAMDQHASFVAAMRQENIDVISLPSKPACNEQVFTRDIGFTIGADIFTAKMASPVRQAEEPVFKSWLDGQSLSYISLSEAQIEGGDILVDTDTVYAGISSRTSLKAVSQLRSLISDYTVRTVRFKAEYLHLDCVFNIISPEEALIYPEAIHKDDLAVLASRYRLIEVSKEEQFTLATNVLSIGDKKILSLPVNKNTNMALRKRGYQVMEIDISEIIKSGGSFRCCTMPVNREN